jgi:hypothetical protein
VEPLRRRLPDEVGTVLDRTTEVGLANVLSTNRGAPASWATAATSRNGGVTSDGLAIVSQWTNAVFSSTASAYASGSRVGTVRVSMPRRDAIVVRYVDVPP